MTINIQKCSNVTVVGHHNHKNCKAVYCIDTGEVYASVLDAANANGIGQSPMSSALTGKTKTCCGKRFCFVSKMMEHLEEITEANRIRAAKVAEYDALIAKENKKQEIKKRIQERKLRLEEIETQVEKEFELLQNDELALRELEDN